MRKFSLSSCGWVLKLHRWNETSGHLYGQSRKDVFERYLSVLVKSRKFESKDSGNATESVHVG